MQAAASRRAHLRRARLPLPLRRFRTPPLLLPPFLFLLPRAALRGSPLSLLEAIYALWPYSVFPLASTYTCMQWVQQEGEGHSEAALACSQGSDAMQRQTGNTKGEGS